MSVSVNIEGNQVTLHLTGHFDFTRYYDFRQAYKYIEKPSSRQFIVDLKDVDWIDSSAMGMLLLLREHIKSDVNNLFIRNAPQIVKDILLTSRFDKLMAIE